MARTFGAAVVYQCVFQWEHLLPDQLVQLVVEIDIKLVI